ncbi:MAG: hypothetical protein IKW90_12375 [Lachnospiraceae bacterium]|nr:hypothetical protein [Lachnospiraceae bacterium]
MKNKKPRSLGRLLIDLTPLLDVIFIVLIVVLAGQDNYSTEADRKYAEAEKYVSEVNAEMEEIDAQNSVLKEQMSAYSSLNEFFNVVTVYAAYSPENRKLRTIYIKVNTDDPITINLNPSNVSSAWTECKKYIEEIIKKDQSLPMILSLDINSDEKMLYRDEESIQSMFMDLVNNYKNLTVRNLNADSADR